jgi:hypothetical protein
MDVEDAHLGTGVLVQLDYRKPRPARGARYDKEALRTRYYTAFEVLLPDGKSELFWKHQLEKAKEPSSRPKRRLVFW